MIVMPNDEDSKSNRGGGDYRQFCEVTPELQQEFIRQLEHVATFFKDVFQENPHVPGVGIVRMKPEAIAKSHKPSGLCRHCPIIGSRNLDENYIKVTPNSIQETIQLIREPLDQKSKVLANLSAIKEIFPYAAKEKVSKSLQQLSSQNFDKIKTRIKLKLFDFGNKSDNTYIENYVKSQLAKLQFTQCQEIQYGSNIHYYKLAISQPGDIQLLSEINGVRTIDFFPQFTQPLSTVEVKEFQKFLDENPSPESELRIGIIDGGISEENPFLQPYVVARKSYVPEDYQNRNHGTFIASTIQYGNRLNNLMSPSPRYSLVDIIAIPNADPFHGKTDEISEDQLMEIIEETMEEHASETKIWNLSLGTDQVCEEAMSDLGIFLDYIQQKYQVQFFVACGNYDESIRPWPPNGDFGGKDRIVAPADSVLGISVGSLALYESENSVVKKDEPSPFSRRGPSSNYMVKPDVVDYGGNLTHQRDIQGLGMKGLDSRGRVIEGVGTSYSNPRIVQKFAMLYDALNTKDLLLAKGLLIHSAQMESHSLLEENKENIHYYGFGKPSIDIHNILQCSQNEVTLIFKQEIEKGRHLEMVDFPYPPSLIRNNKYFGEITMTLVYEPLLDEKFGREYCRVNVDASFGTYNSPNPVNGYESKVPLVSKWDDKTESALVEYCFKWSPVKSYYRKIPRGIKNASSKGWKIRINRLCREGITLPKQSFILILTIKDDQDHDLYSEIKQGLLKKGYTINNLETRQQVRQSQ